MLWRCATVASRPVAGAVSAFTQFQRTAMNLTVSKRAHLETPKKMGAQPKKKEQAFQITSVEAGLKRYKPITPSLRHTVLIDKSNLWRGRPIKELTKRLKKTGGRSSTTGRITVNGIGGGHKQLYRFVDFKRAKLDEAAIIQRFEYDPCRSAFIALVSYPDNSLSYIIAAQGMKVGDTITSSKEKELEIVPGNCMPLSNMPLGTVVHNIELMPGRGGQVARAAGASATLLDKRGRPGYALVAITSKEQRYVPLRSMATIGVVSNPMHHLKSLGKAGRNRWMNNRPKVRGVAMNPVDHPMGGGEGRSSGGRPACNFKGTLSKGFKTVRVSGYKHPLVAMQRPKRPQRK